MATKKVTEKETKTEGKTAAVAEVTAAKSTESTPKETPAKKAKTSKAVAKKTAAKRPVNHGKKYLEVAEKVDRNQQYSLDEAIELVKETSYSKFPGTIEVHLNTAQKGMRGLVTLPFVAGKKLKILAFGKGAADSGADLVGDEEKIAEIEKGKIDFDIVVTTPEWMPKLAKVARVLGPRGLMPNPKNGTIGDNLSKMVADLQGGKTEYKTEPNGQVIHLSLGKVNQSTEEIAANLKALYTTLGRSRVKKVTIAATMGPGVKIEQNSI
jgi:large subunit ribosomal protein L1